MKTDYIIGMDPGYGGAFATLHYEKLYAVLDMPIIKVNGKTRLNIPAIKIYLQEMHSDSVTVIIEDVHAMPGQGVTSMFNFGFQLGALHAVVVGMGWNLETATPQSWKKEFGLIGRDKEAALGKAISLFPEWRHDFARKKDIGRADAALIAYYGYLRSNRNA